jgi:polyisoprenoid-binding protein YceI
VQAMAGGILSSLGHNPTIIFRDLSGDLQVDSADFKTSSVRITVQAISLEAVDVRDQISRTSNDGTREEVLGLRYVEIIYACSTVSASKLWRDNIGLLSGQLTLHGVTRQPGRVTINGDSLRASGECSVKQTAYGIKLVSAVGGAIKVKDDVKITFEIVAQKQG